MGTKTDSGFTIIEVIFFLAISGMLIMGVLSSVTLTIQRQRYTDSMRNFQSYMQQQFTQTLNVVNLRDNSKSCDADGINDDSSTRAGATNCVLLGKLFMFHNNASVVGVYNVIGIEPSNFNPDSYATERDVIRAFNPKFSNVDENDAYRIPWGARVVGTLVKTDRVATTDSFNFLAVLRSPRSGVTLTYAFNKSYPQGPVRDLSIRTNLGTYNENKDINICVQSQDILTRTAALRIAGPGTIDGIQAMFEIDKAQECRAI